MNLDEQLKRLSAGIQAAHAAGNEEHVRLLGQEYRRLQTQGQGATAPAPQAPPQEGGGFMDSFRANVDPILEGMGTTAEVFGYDGTAEKLRGLTDAPTAAYDNSSQNFMKKLEEGSYWDAAKELPGAATEQVGQFAGSVASRVLGAGAGLAIGAGVGGAGGAMAGGVGAAPGAAAGGATGAAVGAFAGPALFEAAQVVGPIAIERAKNNGRDKPNEEDIAYALTTGAGQGALNALAPGASGMLRRMLLEGATEAGQSVIQQTGETAGTNKGLSINPTQAIGEGILGGTGAGAFDATVAAGGAVVKGADRAAGAVKDGVQGALSQTDDRAFSEDEVRAAERIRKGADYSDEILGNVDRNSEEGTAKAAANAALRSIRAEAEVVSSDLKSLAKFSKDTETTIAIKTLMKLKSHQGSDVPESFITDLENATQVLTDRFGDIKEVKQLSSLARQAKEISQFTKDSANDIGGLSQFTRRIDITDPRSDKLMAGGLMMGVGAGGMAAGGIIGAAAAVAANRGINRAARWLDKKTNRRSTIKRFVDSARASGVTPSDFTGTTAMDVLEKLKAEKKAEKAAQKLAIDLAKEQAKQGQQAQVPGSPIGSVQGSQPKPPTQAELKAQAASERAAQMAGLRNSANADMLNAGMEPEHPTYQMMTKYTGLGYEDALSVMEQLEREGRVPQGVAQRFAEDPDAFNKDTQLGMAVQAAVRARANPGFKPEAPTPKSLSVDPEVLAEKARATIPFSKDRRQFKQRQGQAASYEVGEAIRTAGSNLTTDQYEGLLLLKEAIDSPAITREERMRQIRETLPVLFEGPNGTVQQDFWRRKFAPLAAIGNDYAIERTEQSVQAEKEEQFDKAVAQAAQRKKKAPKSAKASSTAQPANDNRPIEPGAVAANDDAKPDQEPRSPQTPEDRALEKYKQATSEEPKAPAKAEPEEKPDAATKVEDAAEPSVEPSPKEKKTKGRNSIRQMLIDRVQKIEDATIIAEEFKGDLEAHMGQLPRNVEGRIEGMIYEGATDRITLNGLAERFAKEHGIPIEAAVVTVNDAVVSMEGKGLLKRKVQKNNALKHDGKYVKGPEGESLHVVDIEVLDEGMKNFLEIAKAVRMTERMVDQSGPGQRYAPGRLKDGAFTAFKDIAPERVDGSFTPMLDFIDDMRNSRLAVDTTIMDQIGDAVATENPKDIQHVSSVLRPKNSEGEVDESPLRAVAQLVHQRGDRTDGPFLLRQEWRAGANLRIYSINGSAHSQGGDLMKGILRAPQKAKVGGEENLKWIFHSIGNLLGFDKRSPAERRDALFTKAGAKGATIADELYRFAEDPFTRTKLVNSSTKELTPLGKIVNDGEGPIQVLNAAHEVKRMVDFARARHKDKAKKKPGELLMDPAVRKDLAENYETDFIVQLDASNNAYQIAGMLMGYSDVLQATGFLPQNGVTDPDSTQGADIYLAPAKATAERVPELKALGLPDSKIRKLFKKPIGTYLYAAEFNSRKDAFMDVLTDIAGGADVVGTNGEGLIPVPKNVLDGLKSPEGHTFMTEKYDINGDVKEQKIKRMRVVEEGGKFFVESGDGLKGKMNRRKRSYESADEAIKYIYMGDVLIRMNDELIREMNTRYPGMRQYLNFANTVAQIVKDKGEASVKVPTKDGMMLEYSFDQVPTFAPVDIDMGRNKPVTLGVRTEDFKLAGRGLAAFIAHSHDAYALRETHRRMKEQGGLKAFNPIHDSYGFHPSDAGRGQQTFVDVMQELGDPNYNIFQLVLEANGINLPQYQAAGGDVKIILGRQGVQKVPASQIPTALS